MPVIDIPTRTWKKLEKFLERFEETEGTEWLTEDQFCELMGYKKNTVASHVSTGKIPPSLYTIGLNGKRFYNKEKVIGIKN